MNAYTNIKPDLLNEMLQGYLFHSTPPEPLNYLTSTKRGSLFMLIRTNLNKILINKLD